MDTRILGWIDLVAIILTLIVIDTVGHVCAPYRPTTKEAAIWSVAYIGTTLAFGGTIWFVWGGDFAQEHLAGCITEKTLSIDNLFIFVIMMSFFKVPREYQREVLLVDIVTTFILRFIFILAGVTLIENFPWVLYFFEAWLLWTAFSQARGGVQELDNDDEEYRPSGLAKFVARVTPITDGFVGGEVIHRHIGRITITPMMLRIIAIGTADVMFAVDSIPAIYSLASEPFLVFSVNAFSLLGLRQFCLLTDGLLDRFIYLHYGLAVILGLIGFRLIVHALHTDEVPFINGDQEWHAVPEASIRVPLSVIITTVLATAIVSVLKSWADAWRVETAF